MMNLTQFRPIVSIAIAMTAAWTVGLFGLRVQPQLLIPLMEKFSVTDPEIGRLYMFENMAYFISLLIGSLLISRFSRIKLALFASVLLVAGNVASAYADNIDSLMFFRIIVSLGGGLVSGSGTATGSASGDPVRAFGLTSICYLGIFSMAHGLIPYALEWNGVTGVYLAVAAYCVLVIPAYFQLLPPAESAKATGGLFDKMIEAPFRIIAIIAMLGLFISELGQNALFTYEDKIGYNIGLSAEDRGAILGSALFIGLGGGVLATWMGPRYGNFKPLIFSLGIQAVISVYLILNTNADHYFYLMLIRNATYSFSLPYLMGTLAALDKEGRWAVMGDAFWNASTIPGPLIATLIVDQMGYHELASWVFLTTAVGTAFFCFTARRTDKLFSV
ncbi:MAG: MFS transporter [Flavobacteriales bacterium]|nr:MFS transporter [Flavobacteriales bacterium]